MVVLHYIDAWHATWQVVVVSLPWPSLSTFRTRRSATTRTNWSSQPGSPASLVECSTSSERLRDHDTAAQLIIPTVSSTTVWPNSESLLLWHRRTYRGSLKCVCGGSQNVYAFFFSFFYCAEYSLLVEAHTNTHFPFLIGFVSRQAESCTPLFCFFFRFFITFWN